ncbi:uromodulin-like [Pleurodeles waltl]|uniref:uromodulin-like n=1 Tax=Pleurodeles waltl TaxID=8319 RepID=UPI0037095F11
MKAWLGLALAVSILCTASAQSASCATDEYFNNTTNACSCNLTMYTSADLSPSPTVQCLSGQMKLKVSRCQLEKSKYDWANMHLLDPSCMGVRVVHGTALVVVSTSTSSHECGNRVSINNTHVFYSNNLTIPGEVSSLGLIAKNNVTYAFSCSYPLNIPVSLATTLNVTMSGIDIPLPGGVGAVMVFMIAYTDSTFTVPYTDATMDINVQDTLYVAVSMPDLDATTFSVLVTRLYATGTSDPNANPSYDIITNKCPSAQLGDLLTILVNGETVEARFKVQVFQISGMVNLYLHAEVEMCTSNPCNQACPGSGQ